MMDPKTMHRQHDDNDSLLAPDQRRREIATILAAGILRLHNRAALLTFASERTSPEKPENSAPNCLEVPDEARLSVHTG
jgi:hypothetical protein